VTTCDNLISTTTLPSCAVTQASAKSKESKTADTDITITKLVLAHEVSAFNATLTRQELIKEQNDDAEIRNLYQQTLDEADISTAPS